MTLKLDPGLHRTIIENPEDNYCKLIAADWLEEHGDEARAELIRAQSSLESQQCKGHCPFCAWREKWGDLYDFNSYKGLHCVWNYGFVRKITCTQTEWLNAGPEIVADQPIAIVVLTDVWLNPERRDFFYYEFGRRLSYRNDNLQATLGPYLPYQSVRPFINQYFDSRRYGHPSEETAQRSLSRACIAWARSRAGLTYEIDGIEHPTVPNEFDRLEIEFDKKWTTEESPTGECWQCYSGRNGYQKTNGPCRCSADWKHLRRRRADLLALHPELEQLRLHPERR